MFVPEFKKILGLDPLVIVNILAHGKLMNFSCTHCLSQVSTTKLMICFWGSWYILTSIKVLRFGA